MPIDPKTIQWDAPPKLDPASVKWDAPAAPAVAPDPTDGNSFLDNALIGAGKSVADTGRGLGQLLRAALPARAADAIGLPTQADIDEHARLDKPIMRTGGGIAGNIAGQAAQLAVSGRTMGRLPAVTGTSGALATALPRAAPLVEAAAQGGAFAATQPVQTGDTRLGNTAEGAAFGAGAAGLGKLSAAFLNQATAKGAEAQAKNAVRDATLAAGRDAGYVVTPSQASAGGLINGGLEALSGKIKTQQAASVKNAVVTNDLAKQALGLPKDQPITVNALNAIRQREGAAYDAVASTGTVTPGQAYSDALDNIIAPYTRASKSFPNTKPNPIIGEIEALRTPSFEADSAVAKIKTLRADADAAYGAGNKELGKALKGGANALEDAIDAHLRATNAPAGMLDAFRAARQNIAKTYSVQSALNQATGDVSASKLGSQVAKGRPLTGDLRTAGDFANSFPKAVQDGVNVPAWSFLDLVVGGLAGAAGSLPLAATFAARPVARSIVTNPAYQRLMVNPSYGPGPVARTVLPALDTDIARQLLTLSGIDATRH